MNMEKHMIVYDSNSTYSVESMKKLLIELIEAFEIVGYFLEISTDMGKEKIFRFYDGSKIHVMPLYKLTHSNTLGYRITHLHIEKSIKEKCVEQSVFDKLLPCLDCEQKPSERVYYF